MNKISKDQFYLELDRATWTMTFQSENGETYSGQFVFKALLTPGDLVAIDRDYRDILGPISPNLASPEAYNIAFAGANLKHRIVKSPAFWSEGDFVVYPGLQIKGGLGLLSHVAEGAFMAETLYKEQLKARQAEALERIKTTLEKLKKDQEVNDELAAMDKPKETK